MPGPAFELEISKSALSLPEKGFAVLIDMFTVREGENGGRIYGKKSFEKSK